jgi:hypothetical protein
MIVPETAKAPIQKAGYFLIYMIPLTYQHFSPQKQA